MKGIECVQEWFSTGRLMRPSAERLNFVDLVRALAKLAGARNVPDGAGTRELGRRIGAPERVAFVLVDGLGMSQLRQLPGSSFLRRHTVEGLQTVYPSTTTAALTSLATGHWPCAHAATGWWIYLPESHRTAVLLPFIERFTERSLERCGISLHEILPLPSLWGGLPRGFVHLLPEPIAGGAFSGYASAGQPRVAYPDLSAAFERLGAFVRAEPAPGFCFLYLPQLDQLMHEKGAEHPEVGSLLLDLDARLEDFVRDCSGRSRVVITGDHGQVDVPAEKRVILPEDDTLRSLLRCLPTGEPTVPVFHVVPGQEERFQKMFAERFEALFALLTTEEIEWLRLLGPAPLSLLTRQRLGSFVGISPEPATFYIRPGDQEGAANAAFHGGLTRAEMEVPLILA